MAEYGIPYMGSKSKICNDLIKIFPNAENFYDLFGGGFSITHAMLTRRKSHYKRFHFNELRPGVCELIKDAIAGKYNYDVFKPAFVSRAEFFEKVEYDAYIKCLWSFGNNGKGYLFGKDIEPYKKSIHNAIIFNEFDELAEKTLGMKKFKDGYKVKDRRLFVINRIEQFRLNGIPEFLYSYLTEDQLEKSSSMNSLQQLEQLERLERLERLQQLEQLQQLQRLEPLERLERLERLQQLEQLQQLQRLEPLQQLERLQQLQQLQQLTFYNTTYDQVPIKENSVIYCDPPYAGTADYQSSFNTNKFLDWAANKSQPVFISEYNITDNRFKLVFEIKKRSMLNKDKLKCVNKLERVYANEVGFNCFLNHARGIKNAN